MKHQHLFDCFACWQASNVVQELGSMCVPELYCITKGLAHSGVLHSCDVLQWDHLQRMPLVAACTFSGRHWASLAASRSALLLCLIEPVVAEVLQLEAALDKLPKRASYHIQILVLTTTGSKKTVLRKAQNCVQTCGLNWDASPATEQLVCCILSENLRCVIGRRLTEAWQSHTSEIPQVLGPTTLKQIHAMLTANVAGIKPHCLVLDPCAGSGSLLAAAKSAGAGAAEACDVICTSSVVQTGTHATPKHGVMDKTFTKALCDGLQSLSAHHRQKSGAISHSFSLMDVAQPAWRASCFDAVVCDPPYGLRASIHGSPGGCDGVLAGPSDLHKIVAALFAVAAHVLVPNGQFACWLPSEASCQAAPATAAVQPATLRPTSPQHQGSAPAQAEEELLLQQEEPGAAQNGSTHTPANTWCEWGPGDSRLAPRPWLQVLAHRHGLQLLLCLPEHRRHGLKRVLCSYCKAPQQADGSICEPQDAAPAPLLANMPDAVAPLAQPPHNGAAALGLGTGGDGPGNTHSMVASRMYDSSELEGCQATPQNFAAGTACQTQSCLHLPAPATELRVHNAPLAKHGALLRDGSYRTSRTALRGAHADVWRAAWNGDSAAVRAYLEAGGDPNARDDRGSTPLHFAAGYGRVGCAGLLLEAGAQPNPVGPGGETPLYRAAAYGRHEMVELLLGAGADPASRTACGATPLHAAAQAGHAAAVRALLRPSTAGTPVPLPAQMAEEQQQLGGLLQASNSSEGATATPRERGRPGCAGHDDGPRTHTACAEQSAGGTAGPAQGPGAAEGGTAGPAQGPGATAGGVAGPASSQPTPRSVADKFSPLRPTVAGPAAGVEATDGCGMTALHLTARWGHVDAAELLLGLGAADPNATSAGTGWSPAHMAARWGHVAVLQRLAAYGADVSARGPDGTTPLDEALHWRRLSCVHWLQSLEPEEACRDQ